mmetsp:Transcript_1915/g.5784  ORF Transcript_1915/g.5784 Transcript_1915/m.5784 type:complete len:168 (-) Transcript_1915:23-526(-)
MDLTNLLQSTPWDRYAGVAGALTTVACLAAGVAGLFVNEGGWRKFAAAYTVGVGLLVAVIELPALYCHSYACIKFKDRLIEDTSFHHGWIRAALYCACTPAMFGFSSILVWPGAQLIATAALYVLVSLKYRVSAGPASYRGFDGGYSKVAASDADADDGPSFGTFTL